MTLHVDAIEAVWFVVTFTALILTIGASIEARRDYRAALLVPNDRREARLIVAIANVRREFLRVVVQALLVSIVVPSLFTDRPVNLSWQLVALIVVPVILLVSSMLDRRDRIRAGVVLGRLHDRAK